MGKVGVVIQGDTGWYCVSIGDAFTHFRRRDLQEIDLGGESPKLDKQR